MRERKGLFAITLTESNKWIDYADLAEDGTGEILKEVIESAKEYANEKDECVIVYIAEKEIEIEPKKVG
jgi:hypothetical protein